MKKKVFLLGLISILLIVGLFFLTGCGSKNNSEDTNNSSNTDDSNSTGSDELVIGDVKKKYEDENATERVYDNNGDFLFPVEDAFTITDKGIVATGTVVRGTVKLQDEVQIIGLNEEVKTTKIKGIEKLNNQYDTATAGDMVGLLLDGIERDDVQRGQVIAAPNSIESHKKFDAEIYMFTREEGGKSQPIFNENKSQYYFRTTDITGVMNLNGSDEQINPGDNNVKITVELEKDVAMELEDGFAIREGGRTIGYGYVTKIYE